MTYKKHLFKIKKKVIDYLNIYKQKMPVSVLIELTSKCNLKCIMCDRNYTNSESGEMSLETFKKIIPLFRHVNNVSTYGLGEPLVNKNIIEMIKLCKDNYVSVGFNTNGTLLSKEISLDLVKMDLDYIYFSIDSHVKAKYEKIRIGADFDNVINNISNLIEIKKSMGKSKPVIGFQFLATTDNIEELSEFIRFSKKMKVENISVSHKICFTKHMTENALYYYPLKKYINLWDKAKLLARESEIKIVMPHFSPENNSSCSFKPWQNFFISWNGDIKPCDTYLHSIMLYYKGKSVKVPEYSFGNINEQSVIKIWNSEKYSKFRKKILKKEYDDICNCCVYSKKLQI